MGRRCGLHTVKAILGGAEVDAAVIAVRGAGFWSQHRTVGGVCIGMFFDCVCLQLLANAPVACIRSWFGVRLLARSCLICLLACACFCLQLLPFVSRCRISTDSLSFV